MSAWRRRLDLKQVALVLIAYCLVFALQTLTLRQIFTSRYPGGNDLLPRWKGGCLLLWEGADPYSEETTLRLQRGIHGRPARPGEDQAAYAYPLYTLAFTWPTCFSRDYATVRAAWMTATIHLILAGTALMKAVAGWRGAGAVWLATLAGAVFVYPNARMIVLGQMSVIVFFALALALWAARRGRDTLAGGALAAATIKPQFSLLIVPWLLLWALGRGRRRLLLGFGATLGGLLALSLALQPDWIQNWITQIGRYPTYSEYGSAIWIMTTYYLGTPPLVEWLLTGVLSLYLVYCWARSWRAPFPEMLWVASLTMLVTHFVSPRTATTHFAVLTLPLFLYFEWWRQQRPRAASVWIATLLTLVLLGSWLLFALTIEGNYESPINYLPIPLLLLGMLLTRRRQLIGAAEEAA